MFDNSRGPHTQIRRAAGCCIVIGQVALATNFGKAGPNALVPQYGTCFMLPFWRVEFSGYS